MLSERSKSGSARSLLARKVDDLRPAGCRWCSGGRARRSSALAGTTLRQLGLGLLQVGEILLVAVRSDVGADVVEEQCRAVRLQALGYSALGLPP